MGCKYDGTDYNWHEAMRAEEELKELKFDMVERPNHYANKQIEVIDYIKDTLTPEQYQGYLLGNALKYISRAGKKDPVKYTEDLRKCVWYLEREIKRYEEFGG